MLNKMQPSIISKNIDKIFILMTIVVLISLFAQVYIIFSCDYPPLRDLPAHTARNYLEYLKLSGQKLPVFYSINYAILPNLGSDLTVPIIMKYVDPLVASKVFLCFSVLIYWIGPALYIFEFFGFSNKSVGLSLLLLPLSFNNTLFYGNINYYSGMGLMFIVLSHFLRINKLQTLNIVHLILHTFLLSLLFFWHLVPFCIYFIIASSFLIYDCYYFIFKSKSKKIKIKPTYFSWILPLSIFFYYLLSGFHNLNPSYEWGSLSRKFIILFSMFRSYNLFYDILFFFIFVILCFYGFQFRFKRECGKENSKSQNFSLKDIVLLHSNSNYVNIYGPTPMQLAIPNCISLVLCVLVYIFLPEDMGTTSGVDFRLLPAILICLICLFGPLKIKNEKKYVLWVLAIFICILFRYGAVYTKWIHLSDKLSKQAIGFSFLPNKCKVLPIINYHNRTNMKERCEEHFLCYGIIKKGIFVPTIFAIEGQQPLNINMPYEKFPKTLSDNLGRYYDYLWIYNEVDNNTDDVVVTGSTEIYTTLSFSLRKIVKRGVKDDPRINPN